MSAPFCIKILCHQQDLQLEIIASTEMWMTEFQGPASNKLEPHLTMMLNIQTQWAVPPEETERSNTELSQVAKFII